jgi:2,3-bisphosphoglycerate-independent phosphoglycerate mutase
LLDFCPQNVGREEDALDLNLMRELSVSTGSKIVLLVLDGLGGLPMDPFDRTELEAADTPNLDALASRSDLGLSRPVVAGVSPGSGPGHLALFGYDPLKYEVGRGVLSALGVGFELGENDLAVRINFATKDESGRISDRRAGRISTEEATKLVDLLSEDLKLEGVEVFLIHEKEHRAVAVFRASGLSDALSDSDPQRVNLKPLPVEPLNGDAKAEKSAELANDFIKQADDILADHHPANTVLLRGFGMHPALPKFAETYKLRAAAIAGYPMFFVHIKAADAAGEDGDFRRKVAVIEEVDAVIPDLLGLGPAVLAVAGDHATPAKMKSHSWHGVPFLLRSEYTLPTARSFGERACAGGSLGVFAAEEIMGLLMGHALKLNRYGA